MVRKEVENIIRVEDVTVGYGDVVILEGISFEVHVGEVFVILGGSGCGKSTLMKSMISLHEPLSGHVIIDGEDIVGPERFGIEDALRIKRRYA